MEPMLHNNAAMFYDDDDDDGDRLGVRDYDCAAVDSRACGYPWQ